MAVPIGELLPFQLDLQHLSLSLHRIAFDDTNNLHRVLSGESFAVHLRNNCFVVLLALRLSCLDMGMLVVILLMSLYDNYCSMV
jgi:hypothetical protein